MATKTWDGGGANNNMTNGVNWDNNTAPVAGDDLHFAGSTRLTPNNDFAADTSFASITFDSGAGNFSLDGNRLTLTGDITNNSSNQEAILNDIILSAGNHVFNAASGIIAFSTSVLSGTGSVTVEGTNGVAIVSTTNTYSGGTTINGLCQAGDGSVVGTENGKEFGSGLITVNTGGTLRFAPGSTGNAYNFANSFKLDGGTLEGLDGDNHLATGTEATFEIGSSGAVFAVQWSGKDLFIDGILSGSGAVSCQHLNSGNDGSAVWITNSSNTYSGIISVDSQALAYDIYLIVNATTALQYATVNIIGSAGDAVFNTIASGTTIIAGLTGNYGYVYPSIGANRTLKINNSVANSYSGAITDSGVTLSIIKSGSGTLTLGGTNTYTGTTTVSGGTLLVTGSLASGSAVTVQNGGTLGGTGHVYGSTTMQSGGTIAPGTGGTTIGQLSTANVTFVSGSIYSVDLNGTTPTFDKILSTGTVDCSSGTLTIASVVNSLNGKVYTIIGASTVSNTFNGLANNTTFAAVGRLFRINYTATTVTLTDVSQDKGFLLRNANELYSTIQFTNAMR